MMNSENNENNNIFKWATKELSQDAVVAWILNMGKNITDEETNPGHRLLKAMLGDKAPKSFTITNIITQCRSIDVLVEIVVDNKKCAVIIEDKTDTFLHDNQMLRYIELISKEDDDNQKYQTIYYVLLKTCYIYSWEKEIYEKAKEQLDNGYKDFNADSEFICDTMKSKYTDTTIFISNPPPQKYRKNVTINKDVTVEACEMFTCKCFSDVINNMFEESTNAIEHDIWNCYNEKKDNTNGILFDKLYDKIKDYFENDIPDKNYRIRMIPPKKNAARPFECYICHPSFFQKRGESFNSPSDNFLILPCINYSTDMQKIEFSVRYNIIADENELHGYKSFDKAMNLSRFKDSKNKLIDYKNIFKNVLNVEGVAEKDFYDNKQKNKMMFIKYAIETPENDSNYEKAIYENTKKLIDYSEKMRDILINATSFD